MPHLKSNTKLSVTSCWIADLFDANYVYTNVIFLEDEHLLNNWLYAQNRSINIFCKATPSKASWSAKKFLFLEQASLVLQTRVQISRSQELQFVKCDCLIPLAVLRSFLLYIS